MKRTDLGLETYDRGRKEAELLNNGWICHHISNSGLKSRKSKVAALHYSKKKVPAKVELIKKTAQQTSIKEYFRNFAVYSFLDEGWKGRKDERMKGEGNVPSGT